MSDEKTYKIIGAAMEAQSADYPSTIFRTYPSEIRCALTIVNFTGQAGQAQITRIR